MEAIFITVAEAKAQCNIEATETADDNLLALYAAAAEATVLSQCNRSRLEALDEYGPALPEELKAAMLILVAQMYKYRELSTQDAINKVPGTYWALIAPHVKLSNRSIEDD